MTKALMPFGRVDVTMVAALSTAHGVDRVAREAAEAMPPDALPAAVRFVDQALVDFTWKGLDVYLTPTDTIAMASGIVLLIRFAVWALSPLIVAMRRHRQ